MDEDVHFIPVGFDYGRLLQPTNADGGLPTDRVYLLYSAAGAEDERAEILVDAIVHDLEETFQEALRTEVFKMAVDVDIFNYTEVFELAHRLLTDELAKGNRVYINISSMPRTVAFAFATAAESIVIENAEHRPRVTTYYASPEDYLALDMKEQLELELDFLERLISKDSSDEEIAERFESISELVGKIDNGFSKGVKEHDGKLYTEIPAPPRAELRDVEKEVLHFLEEEGEFESTTKLAEGMASYYDETYDDTYKSRVMYNVESLEEKGYIERNKNVKSYRTRLSQTGLLWAISHDLSLD